MGLGGVAYCRGGLTVLTFKLINIFIVCYWECTFPRMLAINIWGKDSNICKHQT